MVVLVNASVHDRCCSRNVQSWTIFDVGDGCLSLSDFCKRIIQDHDCLPEEHELKEARVGRFKENLDSVDDLSGEIFHWSSPDIIQIIHASLHIVAVTSVFGNFLHFYVQWTRQDLPSTSNPPLRRNAFELMMCAQTEKASVVLPNKVLLSAVKAGSVFFWRICTSVRTLLCAHLSLSNYLTA